jgi:hypothetical protein
MDITLKNTIGYNFVKINSGGLGAMLYSVMAGVSYCEKNKLKFSFTKEGYDIPRLNGSIDDNPDLLNKNWHSYFTSFSIIDSSFCVEIYESNIQNNIYINDINDCFNILNNKVCLFRTEVYNEINQLVKKTPFNSKTDIVLHIRQTDKITECRQFVPIKTIIEECENLLNEYSDEKTRIYICTDNQKVCLEIRDYFKIKNIEVVWDYDEPDIPLQELRWNNKLPKTLAQQETMNAFKNLFIMRDSKHLIGSRISYFYRVAEILRYPKKCLNIQDTTLFGGKAPYSLEPYLVRPYLEKTISDFINENIYDTFFLNKYNKILKEEKIVCIPNFISNEILQNIKSEIENYQWWSYAVLPNNNLWKAEYLKNIQYENKIECKMNLQRKNFCYRFKRTVGEHYVECCCICCKLTDTIRSFPVMDLLSKIVGCRHLISGECFLSNYSKNDFLALHHDINKGDISVTFSLTYDWDPTYGGILHFCDDNKDIYKSIVPKLGQVTIFKLEKDKGIDHFVSSVNVDANRYTLTTWYNIIY